MQRQCVRDSSAPAPARVERAACGAPHGPERVRGCPPTPLLPRVRTRGGPPAGTAVGVARWRGRFRAVACPGYTEPQGCQGCSLAMVPWLFGSPRNVLGATLHPLIPPFHGTRQCEPYPLRLRGQTVFHTVQEKII